MVAVTARFRTGPRFDTARPEAGDPSAEADLRFVRTVAGEDEIRRRVIELPATARDLLFVIERNLTIDQCVAAVPGARLADAMFLLSCGLVRTVSFDGRGPLRASNRALVALIDRLLALPSEQLYGLLTRQAKHRLGLLQGFRMVLALERCRGPHEQRALAVHFVRDIWRAHGEAGLLPLQRLFSA